MNTKTKERKARYELVNQAVTEELARVNKRIADGAVAYVHTFCGDYQLDYVTREWWYITHPKGQSKNGLNQRSWAGCNDSDWADIMKQLGEARNEYFTRENRA